MPAGGEDGFGGCCCADGLGLGLVRTVDRGPGDEGEGECGVGVVGCEVARYFAGELREKEEVSFTAGCL